MTIAQSLKFAADKLTAQKINLPHLEAEILLSEILKKPREFVLAHAEKKLTAGQTAKFKSQISRRLAYEPTAYLTGHKEFYGLNFKVNKNVLIPRPETELIVEETLKLTAHGAPKALIDVGTGSGCVIIALTKHNAGCKLLATDISAKALAVAKQNAKTHNVHKKIKFLRGNLLSPLIRDSSFKISDSELIITANLPYLDKNWKNLLKSSDSAGLKYEPKIALDGGQDGLDLYRKLATQIKHLSGAANIILLCEIGHLQAEAIKKIFSFAKNCQIKKDLSGLNRLVIIKISKKA